MSRCQILLFYLLPYFAILPSGIIGQNVSVDSLLNELNRTAQSIDKGIIHIELAKQYLRVDLSKTKEHASIAMGFLNSSDSLRALAIDQLGRYYFFTNMLDSAVHYFGQVDQIFNELELPDKMASNNLSIGSALLRQGRFQEATEAFISSAEYFESVDDEGNVAKCYSNIATAFAELKDYDTAIDYNKRALDIATRLDLQQLKMIMLPNLATQFYKKGSIEEALKYYEEAELISIQNGNKRSLALIYNNMGDLQMSQKNYVQAEKHILKAIGLKKELNFVKGLEESYFNLGLIRYKKKDYTKALQYYKQVEPSVQGADRVRLYQELKDVYRDAGNSLKALAYADKAQILSDSLNEQESILAISEMSEKYQVAQKENEILRLTNDNQSLEVAQLQSRHWIILLISSLIALSIGVYSYFKNTIKQKKIIEQQHLIEQQQLMDQLHRNEQDTVVKMIKAQELERNRISNDLHDSLGSKMATLQRNLQMIQLPEDKDQRILDVSHDIAHELYAEIRNISHNINSGVLLDQGLIPALNQMAERVSYQNELQIKVLSVDVPIRLSNIIEIQLFRILQELVTNVIKHAQAKELFIQLAVHDNELNVMVEDDGIGFNQDKAINGMGLSGIKKRLSSLGSILTIDSEINRGTTMIFNIALT